MYGTIAKIHLKPGKEAEMLKLMREFEAENVPGFLSEHVYRMDNDSNEYYMAVAFTDKKQYMLNADSPEQDKRYRRMRALLEDEPEWHDGEIVYSSRIGTVRRAA